MIHYNIYTARPDVCTTCIMPYVYVHFQQAKSGTPADAAIMSKNLSVFCDVHVVYAESPASVTLTDTIFAHLTELVKQHVQNVVFPCFIAVTFDNVNVDFNTKMLAANVAQCGHAPRGNAWSVAIQYTKKPTKKRAV